MPAFLIVDILLNNTVARSGVEPESAAADMNPL